jgi:hypothetical protein
VAPFHFRGRRHGGREVSRVVVPSFAQKREVKDDSRWAELLGRKVKDAGPAGNQNQK